jgi:hypothetical protein
MLPECETPHTEVRTWVKIFKTVLRKIFEPLRDKVTVE